MEVGGGFAKCLGTTLRSVFRVCLLASRRRWPSRARQRLTAGDGPAGRCAARGHSDDHQPQHRPGPLHRGDGSGAYQIVAVPPGQYNLKIELQGFRTAVREKIDLSVDLRTRLDVPMELGQMSETIEVTGLASPMNMTDASLGNVISGNQVAQLPLEARSVVGLLSLQAGAVYVPNATTSTRATARSAARAPTRATSRSMASTSTTPSSAPPTQRRPRHARLAAGVPSDDQQLRRRLRSLERRAGVASHQERHQQVPRRGLLVSARHGVVL